MREINFKSKTGLLISVIVAIIAISWMTLQWKECRKEGLSTLYCIGHVTK